MLNIINQGILLAQTAGQTLNVRGASVVNQGVLRASAGTVKIQAMTGNIGTIDLTGGTLDLDGSYTNEQLRSITGGSKLILRGTWNNAAGIDVVGATLAIGGTPSSIGSIAFNNSTLELIASFTTAQVLTISRSNSPVVIATGGTLNNTGETFISSADTGGLRLGGGTLRGGTVTGDVAIINSSSSSVIDAITLATNLQLNTSATVTNGITLSDGSITIGSPTSNNTQLNLSGAQSISGTGEITFEGNGSPAIQPTGALTIAPGIVIRTGTRRGIIGAAGIAITNNGLISSSTFNQPIALLGTINQQGTIEARNGGRVFLGNTSPPSSFTNYVNGTLTDGTWAVYADSTLTISSATISTNAATVILDGPNSTFAAFNTINNNTGSWTISGGRSFTTAGALANSGDIIVGENSALRITGAFTNSGTVDLSGNLVVEGGDYSSIEAMVVQGYNSGDWLGSGVTSSAAADDPSAVTALGLINNADLGYTSFAGFTDLDGDEVLVKHTYYGDADLTGTVNLDDFNQFLYGFTSGAGGAPAIWLNGDFDYNGAINLADFNLFLFGLENQGGALVSPELFAALSEFATGEGMDVDLSSMPEPCSLSVMGLAAMHLLVRRRRKERRCQALS